MGGRISLQNWATSSTLASYSSQTALYPASNLLQPLRSRHTRTTGVSASWTFDLGTAKQVNLLALVDWNVAADSVQVNLAGADDAAITTNVVNWFLFSYVQGTVNNVVRWYPTTPTHSGTPGPRRYWNVSMSDTVPAGGISNPLFHELGVIWLGDYTAINVDRGVSVKLTDTTPIARSYGGGKYSDPIRTFHELSWSAKYMDDNAALTLKETIDGVGVSRPVLLDVYANVDTLSELTDPLANKRQKAQGTFYGHFKSSPMTFTHSISSAMADVKFDFEEAQA